MIPLKFAISGILGTLTVSGFIKREMDSPDIDTIEPIDTTSIIVPSFNEEPFIKKCLSSIRGQSIIQEYPDMFEIILVDSGSTDDTVKIAEPYVNKIITTTKRGKLTALNLAIDQAEGNMIVSTDADTIYPYFWLNGLLKPFNNLEHDNLMGVVGSTYDPNIPGIPTPIRNIAEWIDRNITDPKRIVGRNSAFWKHGFYQVGKFDETINQMDVNAMIQEEERGFGEKLSKLGKIVFKMNANCIHLGSERIGCRHGLVNRDRCIGYGIGIERFG
jgi:glycosyltransferase involved in cell wall biosynthesis